MHRKSLAYASSYTPVKLCKYIFVKDVSDIETVNKTLKKVLDVESETEIFEPPTVRM